MGKISPLSTENKNEWPFGSPTNYFSLVFSHLQGVKAPKIQPFSDLAINKVSPCPEHISLNAVLWKLWSLALNKSLADTMDRLACDKIEPIFFKVYFGNAVEASWKILSMRISLLYVFQIGMKVSRMFLYLLMNVSPDGQMPFQLKIFSPLFKNSSNSNWQFPAMPVVVLVKI